MAQKNIEIEPLFEFLKLENEELPALLFRDNKGTITKYSDPTDSDEKVYIDLLSTWSKR